MSDKPPTQGVIDNSAGSSAAMFEAAMKIALERNAILHELRDALERDDMPAIKAAARKLCNVPEQRGKHNNSSV